MPVPTRVRPEKNIWIAAGDGDLERVQVRSASHLIRNSVIEGRISTQELVQSGMPERPRN